MLQNLKRKCRPTTLLLIVGFAISLTSVLIGISSVNSIIISLSEMDSETPIYLTMQSTGLSLALAIYVFSIANCLVVTNYWIITKRCDMAIRKAFGWSDCEFPYKSRVMRTFEPLKTLKAPYMARNPVKWGFFRLKRQETPLKI